MYTYNTFQQKFNINFVKMEFVNILKGVVYGILKFMKGNKKENNF